ncbi:hypothetical protein J7L09_01480 [bacterium]|nr:hypothetical protein [bacterium]
MKKQKKQNKKQQKAKVKFFKIDDFSLVNLIKTHVRVAMKHPEYASVRYNERWSGEVIKGIFILKHYGVPILKVDLKTKTPEVISIQELDRICGRRALSRSDGLGIKRALHALGCPYGYSKMQGLYRLYN